MTRSRFMFELTTALSFLPEEERCTVTSEYDHFFDSKAAQGESESDTIASLPSPEKIAESYKKGDPYSPGGEDIVIGRRQNRPTVLGVFLFILLIPVCVVYEAVMLALIIITAVVFIAACVAVIFASAACLGAIPLSRGFILLGVGGLLIAVALTLYGVALLRLIASAAGKMPALMKRVLHTERRAAS